MDSDRHVTLPFPDISCLEAPRSDASSMQHQQATSEVVESCGGSFMHGVVKVVAVRAKIPEAVPIRA